MYEQIRGEIGKWKISIVKISSSEGNFLEGGFVLKDPSRDKDLGIMKIARNGDQESRELESGGEKYRRICCPTRDFWKNSGCMILLCKSKFGEEDKCPISKFLPCSRFNDIYHFLRFVQKRVGCSTLDSDEKRLASRRIFLFLFLANKRGRQLLLSQTKAVKQTTTRGNSQKTN